jgi:hypothetical protein
MPLPLLSMRSSKKSKRGKNQASPPVQLKPNPKVVLKLEKRTKSSSPIETHLAPPFQFQLLEDHDAGCEEDTAGIPAPARHSLESSATHHFRADSPPSPPLHSLPILEVWMDLNDSPPSPMQDDVYSVVRQPAHVQVQATTTCAADHQVDQYQTQLWDAQRLVRVILGSNNNNSTNQKKNSAAASNSNSNIYANNEPLESGAILKAIRAYAVVKQQVQQLQIKNMEQAAALEASQQSQYYDRSGIVVAARKIQSLEQELVDAKKRIQVLETLQATSKQKEEATPEISPSSSTESIKSMSTIMSRATSSAAANTTATTTRAPEDHSNNNLHKPNEETTTTTTTSTAVPEESPSPIVVSLEQVLEMQTKTKETLETCRGKVQNLFLQLATLRRGGGHQAGFCGEEEKSKQELSQQQATEIRDQLQSFIQTIARQQSKQEIQDLQVQLIQQEQYHEEQLLLQASLQERQLAVRTSSDDDDSPESSSPSPTSAFCTPSNKNKTSTSTSTVTVATSASTNPTQSDLELVLHKLKLVPADQVPTPEKHKIRSHIVQLLQRMTESQSNKDLVRLTQELQASQTTVETLTSQVEQANQQREREQDKWETYLQQMTKEKEQVQEQWSRLQHDLETAQQASQRQSQDAHTRESRLQQNITELESQIYESALQFEVCLAIDPMASQREINLADQSFDEATKELALSQTRIQELQSLLGKAREEIETCQDQIKVYQEDNARETRLNQELQLQIGSLQAQIDSTALQDNNQSTHSTEYQDKNIQMAELLQKHKQMQDAQVQLESSVVRVMEFLVASQARANHWLKERDLAVARASSLSLQLAELRVNMDALLNNNSNTKSDENKRPLLPTTNNNSNNNSSNNDDSENANETPRELAQHATIRNLTSKVEQLQEQTEEQTETVNLLRGTLKEVQSRTTHSPTHVWQELQTTQKMWAEYNDTLCKQQSLEPPLTSTSASKAQEPRVVLPTSTAQAES